MNTLALAIATLVGLLMLASFYRLVRGPTIFDRAVAVGVMGTKALLLLALIGFLYGRSDVFVDLAIVYGLLNFMGTVAMAKYFERQRGSS